ncbi:hypothetical protein KFL_001600020 [Klebsormidium nitens]|uniref:Uncharacterized protein n=1 Tax=Klebsormidium nitens TaxID=105231 RepID=A0A1Y1HZX3_KLENI|nr:hypothetical protein KFL_001600020 [Klebsormidium nitens]|eukprot:GAQ83733.1 hypothetical protein KFL_001600020 [Klebsormidium nitens]
MKQNTYIEAGEILHGGRKRAKQSGNSGNFESLYGDPNSWTEVTPEFAAAHAERMKREPDFDSTGSTLRVGCDDKLDLKLSEDLWAVVSSLPGHPGCLMSVTFFDGKTNLPVIKPEGVTLEASQSGIPRGTTSENFYGAWFIQGDMDYKLSKHNGRTYFLDHQATLTVREA